MAKRVIKVFAVQDAKIRKVLTDPLAGPATYGPAIDVPGITQAVIAGDVNTVRLKGDNATLEADTTLGDLTVTFDHAKLSFDVLEVLLGGSSAATGTTPSTVETFTFANTATFGEFVLEFATPRYSDGSDVHMRTAVLKLSSFPELGMTAEDYKTAEGMECALRPLASSPNLFSIISNETSAPISATFVSA